MATDDSTFPENHLFFLHTTYRWIDSRHRDVPKDIEGSKRIISENREGGGRRAFQDEICTVKVQVDASTLPQPETGSEYFLGGARSTIRFPDWSKKNSLEREK